MAKVIKYSLTDFTNITFDGFNLTLPEQTIDIISKLALEVGSPSYVKTPVFQKRENAVKAVIPLRKKGGKAVESINEDWSRQKQTVEEPFQATKIEQKSGIDAQVASIRLFLNKITDKNYIDYRNKIVEVIEVLVEENINDEEFAKVGVAIFDIATNIRYYSKIYAELYSDLISKYEPMRRAFENSFSKFTELFDVIKYVDPDVDYDKFCENNQVNEKRKSLSTFFVNLMLNGIITKGQINQIIHHLLSQIYLNISLANKKNEVNEMTENVALLLYSKDLLMIGDDLRIDGMTLKGVIETIATCDIKAYQSLTSKVKFKFMDIVDKKDKK
jgi:hypothetical protein